MRRSDLSERGLLLSRLFALLPLVPLLAGCHTFAPGTLDQAQAEERVRFRISATEAERLEELLELQDARTLEGIYLGRRGEDVLIDMTISSEARGIRMESVRQRVDIPASSILDVEVRELDRVRTGIVAAGGIAGIAAAIAGASISGRGEDGDRGGDQPEDRIPLVLFRLPFSP